jgi:hypothetical protein
VRRRQAKCDVTVRMPLESRVARNGPASTAGTASAFMASPIQQVFAVAIVSKSMRRTAAAHGIISFVFNAALLALTVNIAASAI